MSAPEKKMNVLKNVDSLVDKLLRFPNTSSREDQSAWMPALLTIAIVIIMNLLIMNMKCNGVFLLGMNEEPDKI